MVERIIVAAREVLAADGYDSLTTNRVAAVAGVSPGSLYQYFPDKTAILDEVIDRYWTEVSDNVTASLADRIRSTTYDLETVRAVADALLTALEADPVLLRVISEELPSARNSDRRTALEQRVRELLGTFLAVVPGASRRPDPGLAAWVVVIALENITLRWVTDAPAYDRAQVIDEIVALVKGYLLG
jgi:AcrR family transcriptional regulator